MRVRREFVASRVEEGVRKTYERVCCSEAERATFTILGWKVRRSRICRAWLDTSDGRTICRLILLPWIHVPYVSYRISNEKAFKKVSLQDVENIALERRNLFDLLCDIILYRGHTLTASLVDARSTADFAVTHSVDSHWRSVTFPQQNGSEIASERIHRGTG